MTGLISIQVDPSAILRAFTEVEQRQVPFAVSRALNRLANEAQKEMRVGLDARFRLRRKDWNFKGIYIAKNDRANKTTWRVIIRIQEQRSHLNKFEEGGEKRPVGGHYYIWEPNDKVFRNRILPQGDPLRPKNLHLHRDPHGRVIGDSRTFLARTGNPELPFVVVQRQARSTTYTKGSIKGLTLENYAGGMGPRTARQKRDLKVSKRQGGTVTLYKLRKSVHVKAQLEFIPTISRTVASRFRPVFDEAMADALRSAR